MKEFSEDPQYSAENFAKFRGPVRKIPPLTAANLIIAYLQRYSSKNRIGLVIDTTDYAADRRVLTEVRFDKVDHMTESIPKQSRCAECGKKVQHQCRKCQIPLHVDCFVKYHSQSQ